MCHTECIWLSSSVIRMNTEHIYYIIRHISVTREVSHLLWMKSDSSSLSSHSECSKSSSRWWAHITSETQESNNRWYIEKINMDRARCLSFSSRNRIRLLDDTSDIMVLQIIRGILSAFHYIKTKILINYKIWFEHLDNKFFFLFVIAGVLQMIGGAAYLLFGTGIIKYKYNINT